MLAPIIDSVLTPVDDPEARLNSILIYLLSGRLELHQFVEIVGEGKYEMKAFVITAFVEAVDGYGLEMYIYAIYSYHTVGRAVIMAGWDLMEKYAKSRGCGAITAQSNIPAVITLLNRFGVDTSYTFLRKEI
jgi:hypothetical protein